MGPTQLQVHCSTGSQQPTANALCPCRGFLYWDLLRLGNCSCSHLQSTYWMNSFHVYSPCSLVTSPCHCCNAVNHISRNPTAPLDTKKLFLAQDFLPLPLLSTNLAFSKILIISLLLLYTSWAWCYTPPHTTMSSRYRKRTGALPSSKTFCTSP